MAERIDVFISSTSRDLQAYREAVAKIVLRLGMYPIDMANFNPTDRNALQLCYDKVQEAEIFVGIYAYRYGYAPGSDVSYTTTDGKLMAGDGQTGVTHLEYQWALERNLPMLLFVVDEKAPWLPADMEEEPGKSRLNAFKTLMGTQHVWGTFSTPDNLAALVAAGLAEAKTQIKLTDEKPQVRLPRRRDHLPNSLSEHYIARHDILDELRLAIIGDDESRMSASHGMIALHGMGGIGKSVIARALCDDPAIRALFPDGVLWAQLASEISEADIRNRLRDWVNALGGTISENASTLDSLKATLVDLLKDRACLLVVDDVWQKKQVEAFRVGGEKCCLLLTTRDAEVARGLGARIQPIPMLSESESMTLIKQWAGGALDGADGVLMARIIKVLGRLPLAIALAGAQLQRKVPDKWLADFDALKLKSTRPEDVHDSLKQTFGLSLDQLEDAERKLYAALAIFKEDEPIREVAIHRLWSRLDKRDAPDAEELLDDLAARALLEIVGDEYPRAAVLHDLLRGFMKAELDGAKAMHQILLDAYRLTQTGKGWHTAPDDGYLYEHLIYHLYNLATHEELREVLSSYEFLRAKLKFSNPNSIIADYDYIENDSTTSLIQSAIRMSAHILEADKNALAHQIAGRLWLELDENDQRIAARLLKSISPPNSSIYYFSHGKGVNPLEVAGGVLQRTLVGHSSAVTSLETISNTNRLASGSTDGTVVIWDWKDGENKHHLTGHNRKVNAIAVNGKDNIIVSADEEGVIIFWDSGSGQLIRKIKIAEEGISSAQFVLDDQVIAIGLHSGAVVIWDTNTQHVVREVRHHDDSVIAIANLDHKGNIVSASASGQIIVWNIVSGDIIRHIKTTQKKLNDIAITIDGKCVLSASIDRTIVITDILTGVKAATLMGHKKRVNGIAISHNGNHVLSASSDHTVGLWDIQTGQKLHTLRGHSREVNTVAFSPDDHFAISASDDRNINVWDIRATVQKQDHLMHRGWVNSVSLTHDTKYAISSSHDKNALIWNTSDGSVKLRLVGNKSGLWSAIISGDGKIALTASQDSSIYVWDTDTGKILRKLIGHSGEVNSVILTENAKLALSGADDKTLRVWDVETGKEVSRLEGHKKAIWCVAITPDAKRAVTGAGDGTLILWNIETGEKLGIFTEHKSVIHAVSISTDGQSIVTASHDRSIIVWDLTTGQHRKLLGHSDLVNGVALARDGKFVVSASHDKTLRIWDLTHYTELARFYADTPLRCCTWIDTNRVIVAGDQLGRVLFLRWVK